jgi:hypothetical protein
MGIKKEEINDDLQKNSCAETCTKRRGKGGQLCENFVCGSD